MIKIIAFKFFRATKSFAKFYVPALVAVLLVVEVGLRLSYIIQPRAVAMTADSGDSTHRVLLVSDSILGTMSDSREAAGQFVLKMNELYKDKVFISEISRGGLLTKEVEAQLEDRVAKDRPSTVIMMVGKSDWVRGWVDRNFGKLAQTWIASLEASKLLMVLAVDIQAEFNSVWPDRTAIAEHKALVAPWKFYSTKDISGIEAFESALLRFPNNIRAIRALVHLYYIHTKVPEGILYLEKLAAVSAEADFVRLQIANLKYDLDQHTKTQVPLTTVADWDQAIKSLPSQRLAFLARMRYLMRTGETAEFANYFTAMTPEQSDVLLPSTYATLSLVIDKAIRLGLRVIILEYPTNHGLPLKRALKQYDDRIELYETRAWLVDSIEAPRLLEAIKIDIEHLTPFGAEVFAGQMVRVYQEGLPKASPSEK